MLHHGDTGTRSNLASYIGHGAVALSASGCLRGNASLAP